jgi:hypothetical protein
MDVFWVAAIIAMMTEAASTSETSVNFHYTTRRNIPEDSHLHSHLESHMLRSCQLQFINNCLP